MAFRPLIRIGALAGLSVNSPFYNVVAWTTTVVLIALSAVLLFTSIFPV